MAMNRETKRMLKRQGELSEDGTPATKRRQPAQQNRPREPRTNPRQFVREVVAELRKVSWPTRPETVKMSIIVLIFLVFMTLIIFGLDFVFSRVILWILEQ